MRLSIKHSKFTHTAAAVCSICVLEALMVQKHICVNSWTYLNRVLMRKKNQSLQA
jgi:hypothetical protein